ncbi:inositol monophosphatase family protein [Peptoniphilus sp. SGI.035]|uniref:inositol monophosphatase family protein n=1 Tax=Peptoniphilus sp. SGI.035 TaxID=3420564 RepID=UPI003D055AD8
MINYHEILIKIEKLMKDASKIFFELDPKNNFEMKGRNDYVTEVDFKVQEFLEKNLLKLIEGSNLLAEEKDKSKSEIKEYTWVLDPVDGTTNLVHEFNHSVISLALLENSQIIIGAIYDPFRDEFFSAIKGEGAKLNGSEIKTSDCKNFSEALIGSGTGGGRVGRADETFEMLRFIYNNTNGIRHIGSAALEMCYASCGRYDAFIDDGLNLWDYAAGTLIVREAGGLVINIHGEEVGCERFGGIICGNKNIVEELRRFVY